MASTARLAGLVIGAEIASMAGFASFAVTLPHLSGLWGLSPSNDGWISGAYYIGYVVAVPFLVGLSDWADARWIYLCGCLIGTLSGVGFAWGAHDVMTASLYRILAGASLAGTYMPGLTLLTERLGPQARLRVIPYYTASFGIGVSLSFCGCSWLGRTLGWPAAFVAGSGGSAIAALLVLTATAGWPPSETATTRPASPVLDFRPVFSNRAALGYIVAYGGHCWELFALRAWMLAFLAFVASRNGGHPSGPTLDWWISAVVLSGVPASILGAELALAWGRGRLIRWAAWLSVATGIAAGLITDWGFLPVLVLMFAYNVAVSADSGALTTGAVAAARPGQQGITLAMHSLIGFGGGTLGPIVVGLVLDVGGGLASPVAWAAALVTMAAGSAIAGLAQRPTVAPPSIDL